MAATVLQFNSFTIGGSSFLTDLESITATIDSDTVENHGLTNDMVGEQVAKVGCRLEVPLFSTISTPERVSHLGLTACTLGTPNLLTDYGVESLDFNVAYQQVQRPSAGSLFRYPQNVRRNITASVTFGVPDTGLLPMLTDMTSATYGDRVKNLSFTINSVVTTLPVLLKSTQLAGQRDGLQMVTAELGPRVPTSGAYPAAPTGTTSLFEKALNSYRTGLAVVLSNTVTTGETLSGTFLFDGLQLQIRDGALVMANYSFVSQGAFTCAVPA